MTNMKEFEIIRNFFGSFWIKKRKKRIWAPELTVLVCCCICSPLISVKLGRLTCREKTWMFGDSKSINLTLTKSAGGSGPMIAQKQCRPLCGNVSISRTRHRLATATMSDRCLPGLVAAWPLRTLPTAAKGDRRNWSRRLPSARAGTYRLINRHCQRVLQVPAGDHEGWHGNVTAKPLPYCKLLASLPRWAAGNGGGGVGDEQGPKTSRPAHKQTHKSLHLFSPLP